MAHHSGRHLEDLQVRPSRNGRLDSLAQSPSYPCSNCIEEIKQEILGPTIQDSTLGTVRASIDVWEWVGHVASVCAACSHEQADAAKRPSTLRKWIDASTANAQVGHTCSCLAHAVLHYMFGRSDATGVACVQAWGPQA